MTISMRSSGTTCSGVGRQIPVLHLPCVVEHVVGAVPDHELDRPGPRRHPAGVVVADRRAERLAVGAEILGASPSVVWRDDADLLRELLDLGAVCVVDDLVPIAPAAARTLPELGGYA